MTLKPAAKGHAGRNNLPEMLFFALPPGCEIRYICQNQKRGRQSVSTINS
jgi:hypothetical protein